MPEAMPELAVCDFGPPPPEIAVCDFGPPPPILLAPELEADLTVVEASIEAGAGHPKPGDKTDIRMYGLHFHPGYLTNGADFGHVPFNGTLDEAARICKNNPDETVGFTWYGPQSPKGKVDIFIKNKWCGPVPSGGEASGWFSFVALPVYFGRPSSDLIAAADRGEAILAGCGMVDGPALQIAPIFPPIRDSRPVATFTPMAKPAAPMVKPAAPLPEYTGTVTVAPACNVNVGKVIRSHRKGTDPRTKELKVWNGPPGDCASGWVEVQASSVDWQNRTFCGKMVPVDPYDDPHGFEFEFSAVYTEAYEGMGFE